jgi:DNA primase small subunit
MHNLCKTSKSHTFETNTDRLGQNKNKDIHLSHPLHPMLSRALEVLETHFIQHIIPASGHGLLASPDRCSLLENLPTQVRDKLSQLWNSSKDRSTPSEKWEAIKTNLVAYPKATAKAGLNKSAKQMSGKERNHLETWVAETVFQHPYPRLDINLSTHRNHLLKSPFCVHPKTGRVCVPIAAANVLDFDPFAVPTLAQLAQELDDYNEKHGAADSSSSSSSSSSDKSAEWQKTNLKPYFDAFQKGFHAPLIKSLEPKRREEMERQAAMTGKF